MPALACFSQAAAAAHVNNNDYSLLCTVFTGSLQFGHHIIRKRGGQGGWLWEWVMVGWLVGRLASHGEHIRI